MSKAALELARRFHDVYERLAPSHGYTTREDTRQFDPSSPNGQLMVATCEELIAKGFVLTPARTTAVQLEAHPDGRRSRLDTPDRLEGWQFLGQVDDEGKPVMAPHWVVERFRHDPKSQTSSFHTTRSLLTKELNYGDWVVKDSDGIHRHHPSIFVLPAATISRWYRVIGL